MSAHNHSCDLSLLPQHHNHSCDRLLYTPGNCSTNGLLDQCNRYDCILSHGFDASTCHKLSTLSVSEPNTYSSLISSPLDIHSCCRISLVQSKCSRTLQTLRVVGFLPSILDWLAIAFRKLSAFGSAFPYWLLITAMPIALA